MDSLDLIQTFREVARRGSFVSRRTAQFWFRPGAKT